MSDEADDDAGYDDGENRDERADRGRELEAESPAVTPAKLTAELRHVFDNRIEQLLDETAELAGTDRGHLVGRIVTEDLIGDIAVAAADRARRTSDGRHRRLLAAALAAAVRGDSLGAPLTADELMTTSVTVKPSDVELLVRIAARQGTTSLRLEEVDGAGDTALLPPAAGRLQAAGLVNLSPSQIRIDEGPNVEVTRYGRAFLDWLRTDIGTRGVFD